MKRIEVKLHRIDHGGKFYPALDVKVQKLDIDPDAVRERFGCTRERAERALEWAWESAREDFWGPDGLLRGKPYTGRADDALREAYGEDEVAKLHVWSAGRSGGWLVVEGLPDVETWDGRRFRQWETFGREIRTEIAYLISADHLMELIEENEWADIEPVDANATVARYDSALAELHA